MESSEQATTINDNGKTVALVSYLSIIGWIIAYVIYGGNKTTLGAYHLRQTIGLYVIGIICCVLQMLFMIVPYLGWVLGILLIFVYIGLFVLWLIGFIAAINGQEKPIPIIGNKSQQWFSGIK